MEPFSIIYFLMMALLATNLFILTLSINFNSGHNSPWCDALVTLCDIHGASNSLEKEFARAISTNATGGIHLRRSNCASTLHNRTFIHYHPAIIHFTLTISNNNKQAKQSVPPLASFCPLSSALPTIV